jgi:hypothetical protein
MPAAVTSSALEPPNLSVIKLIDSLTVPIICIRGEQAEEQFGERALFSGE